VHVVALARGAAASSRAMAFRAEHALRHVPLSTPERVALTLLGSAGALASHSRADLVAAVGELTGEGALRRLKQRIASTSEGSEILREQPRVTSDALRSARRCEAGTFGSAYSHFMDTRSFDPSERPSVRFVDDPELAYVACRAREAHDFWHALTGCPASVDGEIALKAFEFANTGLPVGLLSLAASARVPQSRRSRLFNELIPWGLSSGNAAFPLPAVFFEQRLDQPLRDLQRELRIRPAPFY